MTERTQGRWAIFAFTLWVGLILGFAVFGYCYPRSHTVYDIYARASHAWWAGDDMYVTKGTDFYRYSPLFAVAISPMALLGDGPGNAFWRIVNVAVFAAGLWFWARRCLPGERSKGEMAALFLLVLPTSLHSMYIAQANVFMIGACLLALAAAADEKWASAALWLTAATLVKGYPIALVFLLIALFPRKLTLHFCLALAIGLSLPFLAGSPSAVAAQYSSWFAHLRDSTAIMRERLRSIDHLFTLYGEPLEPRTFLYMQMAAGLVVLGLCLIHARQQRQGSGVRGQGSGVWGQGSGVRGQGDGCINDRGTFFHFLLATVYWLLSTSSGRGQGAGVRGQGAGDGLCERLTMTFFLFSAWAMLFGPATETCTYVIVAPTIAWTIIEAFSQPRNWPTRVLLIASLLLMGPLPTDLVGSTIRNFANEHGSQPLGACLLTVHLIRLALKPPKPEPAQAQDSYALAA